MKSTILRLLCCGLALSALTLGSTLKADDSQTNDGTDTNNTQQHHHHHHHHCQGGQNGDHNGAPTNNGTSTLP